MAGLIYFWKVATGWELKKEKSTHLCLVVAGTQVGIFSTESRRASHLLKVTLENHAQRLVATRVYPSLTTQIHLSESLSQGEVLLHPH